MSLVISDLSKSRHGTSLLNGVNLELRSGAIHGLFGRNGAGKSTLLNIIANRLHMDFCRQTQSISAAAASAALCRARSAVALRKKKRLSGLILGAVWGILTMWAR